MMVLAQRVEARMTLHVGFSSLCARTETMLPQRRPKPLRKKPLYLLGIFSGSSPDLLCALCALCGKGLSEFTTEPTESTEIQIASCWWGREVFRRAVLLQGQLPAAADRLAESGAVEVFAQVHQG